MINDLQIGIVRDARFTEHRTGPFHPEQPKRLRAVYRMLDAEFFNRFTTITPEPVPPEALSLVHSEEYISAVRQTSERSFASLAPDTPVSSKSYRAASLAVGGCIQALNLLLMRKCSVCFCLVRPPGHHSLPDKAGGYCIFNNLGVAAKYAVTYHHIDRILIIDWDIHHGNGIQSVFYDDKKVFYFSTHDISLYPNTGGWDETGKDDGKGYTVNIPIPADFNDADFYSLYQNLLTPIISSYRPELIFVAAGFDAHHEDHQSLSRLTETVFNWLTRLLLVLRRQVNPPPPILFSLEGGYNPKALAGCVRSVLTALTEKEISLPVVPDMSASCQELIAKARNIHSPYRIWTY